MKTAQVIVTSCSRRDIEVEQIRRFLRGNGYAISPKKFDVCGDADLIVISTCAYTKPAEDYAIDTVLRAVKNKRGDAKLIVCGCLPEIHPERLKEIFDGPCFGPRSYEMFNEILSPARSFHEFPRSSAFHMYDQFHNPIEKLKAALDSYSAVGNGVKYALERIRSHKLRHDISRLRGFGRKGVFYIQVQEGCPSKCAYCAIRLAIKELKSCPVDQVVDDVRNALASGHREICLVGDSSAAYGLDMGTTFGHLLDAVMTSQGDKRFLLHLVDISPVYLDLCYEQIKSLAQRKMTPSVYIPIQSAHPRILSLMRRSCDMGRVMNMLTELKKTNSIKIGTSIIMGFPSETEEECQATIDFCRQVGFDWIHCHDFSARPQTEAASLPGQVPSQEIARRTRLAYAQLRRHSLVTTEDW